MRGRRRELFFLRGETRRSSREHQQDQNGEVKKSRTRHVVTLFPLIPRRVDTEMVTATPNTPAVWSGLLSIERGADARYRLLRSTNATTRAEAHADFGA